MRYIQKTETKELKPLKVKPDILNKFSYWTCILLEDALSKRFWQDSQWKIALRQYEGIPSQTNQKRSYQANLVLEIPLGAKQCDTVVSAMVDLIFQANPPFTVRAPTDMDDTAFAFQLLVNKLVVDKFVNYRNALDELINDTVQMGTGIAMPIFTEEVVKHATFKSIDQGPRCYCVPPEDFVVPGGSYTNVDSMSLMGYRTYYNEAELQELAAQHHWDVSQFKPAANVDWVRQRRMHVAMTDESIDKEIALYEVYVLYGYYDIDGDGIAEDLYYVYDRTSRAIGYVSYAPYDSRPFVIARYQLRPHIFYGLGVMQMSSAFQAEVSEWHTFKSANAMLANTRVFAYRLGATGLGEELVIGPNKSIGLANPKEDLVALQISDIYQSAMQYESQALLLSEERVGTNALGSMPISAGKRVPAATAMSMMQQQNRRFAAPFNNIRIAAAELMTGCLLRLQEQYLKGGEARRNCLSLILRAVGGKNTKLIEEMFAMGSDNTDLRDQLTIEVTASSSSVNREADKQSAVQLVTLLGQYYDKLLQLGSVLANPQTPPELKQLATEIAKASSIAIERMVRTFDNVRDPDQLIPKLGGEPKQNEPPTDASQQQPGNSPGANEDAGQTEGIMPSPARGGAGFGKSPSQPGIPASAVYSG